jgi:hypothetical protein
MFIHEVNTDYLEQDWLNFPAKLYKPSRVKPLMFIEDVKRIFDPNRNSFLTQGKVARWIAYDAHNFCAGRIAAFYHPADGHTGRIGFFESIENEAIAFGLFDVAKSWLVSQHCTCMEGPENFGEKDRFWGLMTGGYETPALYLDNFNPPFYSLFFRQYGFTVKETIYSYCIRLKDIPIHRLELAMERNQQSASYTYVHYSKAAEERLAGDIHAVYTASFDAGKRISHLSVQDIRGLLQQVKPLLNEQHFWLAYADGLPAGFLLFLNEPRAISSVPQPKRIKGFAFATIPAYRGKGIELGLCVNLYRQFVNDNIPYEIFLSGINSITHKMISFLTKMGAERYKEHQLFTLKF